MGTEIDETDDGDNDVDKEECEMTIALMNKNGVDPSLLPVVVEDAS